MKNSKLLVELSIIIILLFSSTCYSYNFGNINLDYSEYESLIRSSKCNLSIFNIWFYIAPVSYNIKVQGNCGSCWAFTSVGCMESHILMMSNEFDSTIDLSEQQLISGYIFNQIMSNYGCSGGTAKAITAWKNHNPEFESDFPYVGNDSIKCVNSDRIVPFRVIDFWAVNNTVNAYKKSIYFYGACYLGFNVGKDFLDFWDCGEYDVYIMMFPFLYQGSHAVMLIGWDDSKDAFLCKNSWGANQAHPDGTFWLSYDNIYYYSKQDLLGLRCYNFSIDRYPNIVIPEDPNVVVQEYTNIVVPEDPCFKKQGCFINYILQFMNN